MAGRIILVSNRLPVSIMRGAEGLELKRSMGGLATALGTLLACYPMLWIGWGGEDRTISQEILAKLKYPRRLIPIPISKRAFVRYYDRMANGVIWPVMHGFKPSLLATKADWAAVKRVVSQFADAVCEIARPDDVIWVHDYHLLLLPETLRKRGVANRVGFFLHTPFPPVRVLSRSPHYKALLRSLSQVDVLGLQSDRDVKNFKKGLAAAGITMREGAVVNAYPIGIDYGTFNAIATLKQVARYVKDIEKLRTGSKRLVLSVSRLDYTKGIAEQVEAFGRALERLGPDRASYKLIVAPSRETVEGYMEVKRKVEEIVERVNTEFQERYGVRPIEYEYRAYGLAELRHWYKAADVMLATPVIDGMNLVVKEYVASRGRHPGAIVLTKTAGAAFQLKDAVLVKPGDVDDIAKGIVRAVSMSWADKRHRWQRLTSTVKGQDVYWWAGLFLKDLAGGLSQAD